MPLLGGCCSMDLRLGTKIIGVICLIFAILGFITTGIICAMMAIMQDAIAQAIRQAFPPDDGTVDPVRGVTDTLFNRISNNPSFNNIDDDYQDISLKQDKTHEEMANMANYFANNISIVLIFFLVILGQQFIEIVASSCLIDGIRKNKRGLLMPWIVMHVLYVIIEIGFIVLFITLLAMFSPLYKLVLPMIAVDLIWMAIHIYFILVVISQFQALGLIRMHDEMSMKP